MKSFYKTNFAIIKQLKPIKITHLHDFFAKNVLVENLSLHQKYSIKSFPQVQMLTYNFIFFPIFSIKSKSTGCFFNLPLFEVPYLPLKLPDSNKLGGFFTSTSNALTGEYIIGNMKYSLFQYEK